MGYFAGYLTLDLMEVCRFHSRCHREEGRKNGLCAIPYSYEVEPHMRMVLKANLQLGKDLVTLQTGP
jgi:hypothetical protein